MKNSSSKPTRHTFLGGRVNFGERNPTLNVTNLTQLNQNCKHLIQFHYFPSDLIHLKKIKRKATPNE